MLQMINGYILDIGANLSDPMYEGVYNGKKKHKEDLEDVLERSWKNGLKKIIITSGSLDDSIKALKIASINGNFWNQNYSLHPTVINLIYFNRKSVLHCWLSSNTL